MPCVGVCESCAERINARERWEEACVLKAQCMSCGSVGRHAAFKTGFLGNPDCTDCLTMTHCEFHHKEHNLYPPETFAS